MPHPSRKADGAPSPDHNVPAPLTTLVGRAKELESIAETLRRARLVTITGPGGVGKTRLALALARGQIGRRPNGVWLVDLASGPDTPDVAAETARRLGVVSPRGRTTTESLRRYLRDRDLLLVLDNCEHVLGACADLAESLLTSCDDIRILATSRESLKVSGEILWRLEPLGQADAYRLFLERARQRQPDFIPSEETATTIVQLCARLDHLPLAIELAAARVSVMSPAEVLSSLEARLTTLDAGQRPSTAHHRTVRAAVEWSERLLDLDEQRAFRSLAVFVGGFDARAAGLVAPGLTFDMLARLVDKSLVTVARQRGSRSRYRLLETVREYAYELLIQTGELEAAQDRHLRYFLSLADVVLEGWPSTHAVNVVDELQDDYENVRTAVERAAFSDPCSAMPLLNGTRDLFLSFGQADGLRLARQLLNGCLVRDRHRVEVQILAGLLAFLLVDIPAATSDLTEAAELAADLDEKALEGWARFFQGLSATLAEKIDRGRVHLEASRALLRQAGVRIGEARSDSVLGLSFVITHESVRGRQLVERALTMNVAENDSFGQGQCHVYLGIIAEATDPSNASSHYRQAVECLRPYRDASLLPFALVGQAGVLGRRDPATALRVAAAAFAIRARVGGDFAPFFRARADRIRSSAASALGDQAGRVWREGSRLNADDAIALAFGAKRPPVTSGNGLSSREQEVVRFVAEGLSNKQIAARLHVSVRTVESHVRNILAKLGLDNRTQLATWARDRFK